MRPAFFSADAPLPNRIEFLEKLQAASFRKPLEVYRIQLFVSKFHCEAEHEQSAAHADVPVKIDGGDMRLTRLGRGHPHQNGVRKIEIAAEIGSERDLAVNANVAVLNMDDRAVVIAVGEIEFVSPLKSIRILLYENIEKTRWKSYRVFSHTPKLI